MPALHLHCLHAPAPSHTVEPLPARLHPWRWLVAAPVVDRPAHLAADHQQTQRCREQEKRAAVGTGLPGTWLGGQVSASGRQRNIGMVRQCIMAASRACTHSSRFLYGVAYYGSGVRRSLFILDRFGKITTEMAAHSAVSRALISDERGVVAIHTFCITSKKAYTLDVSAMYCTRLGGPTALTCSLAVRAAVFTLIDSANRKSYVCQRSIRLGE